MDLKLLSLRLLFIITDAGAEKKIDRLFSEMHLPIYYQCRGQGTARSEMLDLCGLQGTARLITAVVVPKVQVEKLFENLDKYFRIKKKGRGVAVTVPVTGVQERIMALLKEEVSDKIKNTLESEAKKMKEESRYAMILASVRSGYSDEVVEAASAAGAHGGSVIRGRRQGSRAMVQFLGISLQEEQDFVMIIVPKEKKSAVMQSIGAACGLKTEAHGFLISVPVDEVLGIEDGTEE